MSTKMLFVREIDTILSSNKVKIERSSKKTIIEKIKTSVDLLINDMTKELSDVLESELPEKNKQLIKKIDLDQINSYVTSNKVKLYLNVSICNNLHILFREDKYINDELLDVFQRYETLKHNRRFLSKYNASAIEEEIYKRLEYIINHTFYIIRDKYGPNKLKVLIKKYHDI